MKLKALLVATAAAALCVSVASAAPSPGKGKHHGNDQVQPVGKDDHGPGKGAGKHDGRPGKGATTQCKGKQLVLGGLYVSGSADATGAGSFAMLVKRGAGHAKKLDLRGKQATITVDAATKIHRHGHATLADLVANDRVVVLVRACRATDAGADPVAPTLLARAILAVPAKGDGTGTTTTGTTTTDTTETGTVPKIGTGPSGS